MKGHNRVRALKTRTGGPIGLILASVLLAHCSVKDRDFSNFLADGDTGVGGDGSMGGDNQGGAGVGGGIVCEEVTQEVACTDKCGSITVCAADYDCGGCLGEATCGDAGVCSCEDDPCALSSIAVGDTLYDSIVGMAVDSTGAVYLLGTFRGSITIGDATYTATGSYNDTFLVKFDPEGNIDWSRGWGDSLEQDGIDVAVDGADNVIVAMDNSGVIDFDGTSGTEDLIVVKLDSEGEVQWVVQDSTEYSSGLDALAIDRANNDAYVGGHFWGTLKVEPLSTSITATGDQSYYDAFLLRLDAAGIPQALKRYGDEYEDQLQALAPGADYVYASAYFYGDFSFGGVADTVSTTQYYGLAIGKISQFGLSHTWSKGFDTEIFSVKMASDPAGNLYLTGEFTGDFAIDDPPLSTTDYESFLAKLGDDGNTLWAKQYAGVTFNDVVTSPAGDVYVAGHTYGEADLGEGPLEDTGSSDLFAARLDAQTGDLVWLRHYSIQVGDQSALQIVVGAEENASIGVSYEGTVNFGTGSHPNQGATDVAVVRYATP